MCFIGAVRSWISLSALCKQITASIRIADGICVNYQHGIVAIFLLNLNGVRILLHIDTAEYTLELSHSNRHDQVCNQLHQCFCCSVSHGGGNVE